MPGKKSKKCESLKTAGKMSREEAEKKGGVTDYTGDAVKENPHVLPHQKATEGVDILLGDPKKAVVKLSIPIIVAMSV